MTDDRLSQVRDECAEAVGALTANTFRHHFLTVIERQCESEIEKMMALSLASCPVRIEGQFWFSNLMANVVTNMQCDDYMRSIICGSAMKAGAFIFQQQKIGKYRADFIVVGVASENAKPVTVVVECDGHDFHERTKQQAQRDRRRDREMTALGYRVFRFTGSEIWADPRSCANEVMSFLSAEMARIGASEEAEAIHEAT
ncbi:DUF559 domain-containing protein [Azospirillum sp. TSA2s]|uniref:DUF559 domain-containing protein n=1 Tax=Azospirillum sp. TSA2s TaxID=709810 RepID=UPI0010AA01CD|nr:DUF559 domain-containing protein [Azospirillum sp. TSA2s]QCG93930.1 DUF559 domain-containing protein [Azospirillum sp. TSA2s]